MAMELTLQEMGESFTFFHDMSCNFHAIVDLGVINHNIHNLSGLGRM